MGSAIRTAGAPGSVQVSIGNQYGQAFTPYAAPTVQWFTDPARTLGATTLTVTGSGSTYTASWTGVQAPAVASTRYLKVTIPLSAGVSDVDVDDDITFADATSSIASAFVTLADVKAHLNDPTSTNDVELQGFIDAAVTVAEELAGTILPKVIIGETHDGGSTSIVTLFSPILSVQAISEYVGTSAFTLTAQPPGSTVDNYGYEVTNATGGVLVRRGSAGVTVPFQGGRNGVVISYTAGYATVPAQVRLGVLELIRHWWQRSQNGGRSTFRGTQQDEGYTQVGAYLVPNFAAALLTSTPSSPSRLPGLA